MTSDSKEIKKGTNNNFCVSSLLWCGRESNPRHKDFQSFALPTELPHQPKMGRECKQYFFSEKMPV